jgi:hypothetical protein
MLCFEKKKFASQKQLCKILHCVGSFTQKKQNLKKLQKKIHEINTFLDESKTANKFFPIY